MLVTPDIWQCSCFPCISSNAVFIWNVSPHSMCILPLDKGIIFKSPIKNIEILKDLLEKYHSFIQLLSAFSFCWENILNRCHVRVLSMVDMSQNLSYKPSKSPGIDSGPALGLMPAPILVVKKGLTSKTMGSRFSIEEKS